MKTKTLEVWRLEKENKNENRLKIQKLNQDIADMKQIYKQWEKQSKITKR
jgi:phage-related tail protein